MANGCPEDLPTTETHWSTPGRQPKLTGVPRADNRNSLDYPGGGGGLSRRGVGAVPSRAGLSGAVGRLFGGSWVKSVITGVVMSVLFFLLFDKVLDVVLRRMQRHHDKKRSLLSRLHAWDG